jgi:glycosyltransferase involved in cell wall biosynthesis
VKIAIVTDTWLPEVNGVVTTLSHTRDELVAMGHEVHMVSHQGFFTIPMPGYKSIRLALFPKRRVAMLLDQIKPDSIHIATEGPLGVAARAYCIKRGLDFSTCYHTKFPEYLRARLPVPLAVSYAWIRNFHNAGKRLMVSTPSLAKELSDRGFKNIVLWNKGVDTKLFHPGEKAQLDGTRPIFMYVGRVAVEKNLEAFLSLELPGSQYVVGDGPDLEMLKSRYTAHFTGFLRGQALASTLAAADVFVFPSLTDTYGLVLLEAMACGVPVAAFPVTGPKDVIQNGVTGYVNEDLKQAAIDCLKLKGDAPREYALRYSWKAAAEQFAGYMVPALRSKTSEAEDLASAA